MLKDFSVSELGVLVVSVLGGAGLIITRIQHSRCVRCSVCWGMCTCVRNVIDENIAENNEGVEIQTNT